MGRVRDIIQRDTRASQPLDVGTLYYVTDEGITERSDGTNWQTYSDGGTTSASTTQFLLMGA